MALSAVTLYSPNSDLQNLFVIAGLFFSVNIPSVTIWVLLGHKLRNLLTLPKHLKFFNWSMAFLLMTSLVFML
jgi:threonine/homoserine/homoserine lactone efflux protein